MLKNVGMLQLSWFTTGMELASPMRLFSEIFGREPDAFQKLQPPQVPFPITVQTFEHNGVEHKLQSYAGRIDYLVSGVQRSQEIPVLPTTPEQLLSEALGKTARGAELIGNINRAAIILTLTEKLGSLDEASDFFTRLFGGAVNFSGSSDLQFQLNRPIKRALGVTDINRLLKWTCNTVQVQQVLNHPGSFTQILAGDMVEYLLLNYMIDANTVASSVAYPPSEHHAIFSKLASIALDQTRIKKIQDL